MLLPWLHFLNAPASSLIFLIRRLSLFHKNTPAGYGNASSPADCGMSSPTRPAVQQVYVLGQFGSRPRSCSCCVFPAEPPPLKRRLVLMAGCVYIWSGATGNVNQGPQKPLGFIGSLGGRCLCSALSARRHSALCLLDTGAQRLTGLHLVGSSQVTDFFFSPWLIFSRGPVLTRC